MEWVLFTALTQVIQPFCMVQPKDWNLEMCLGNLDPVCSFDRPLEVGHPCRFINMPLFCNSIYFLCSKL